MPRAGRRRNQRRSVTRRSGADRHTRERRGNRRERTGARADRCPAPDRKQGFDARGSTSRSRYSRTSARNRSPNAMAAIPCCRSVCSALAHGALVLRVRRRGWDANDMQRQSQHRPPALRSSAVRTPCMLTRSYSDVTVVTSAATSTVGPGATRAVRARCPFHRSNSARLAYGALSRSPRPAGRSARDHG